MKRALIAAISGIVGAASAHVVELPSPVIVAPDLRANEKPVEIQSEQSVIADNALYRRVRTSLTFTNPNTRQMSADFEFPIPASATVCGYELEVDGVMVPGVVTEKEKARVAFETEKAKNVDPGIVEHVAGNIWKTRIFPLLPNTPRRATVDYVVEIPAGDDMMVYERDGDDVFAGQRTASGETASLASRIAAFAKGAIIWDASSSAEAFASGWRATLAALGDVGEWDVIAIRNDAEKSHFTDKAALLTYIDSLAYDGGTDIGAAVAAAGDAPCLLFTDELDTLGLDAPDYESRSNIIIASRGEPKARTVHVRKLAKDETPPEGVEVKASTLLATAWAAERVADLASQADTRKDEFLSLGRRYGVASPVTSLIVLESLDQYIKHKVEPPTALSFHDEWVRRMAAKDDAIENAKADADHKSALLALWQERVEWWNSPIPPKRTPKSGLFDGERDTMAASEAAPAPAGMRASVVAHRMRGNVASRNASAEVEDGAAISAGAEPEIAEAGAPVAKSAPARHQAGGGGATITIAAWNPKAPYLDAISKADDHYAAYLKEKKANATAPAFYMDAAGWFFKNGDKRLGARIISNMAEFKLEDAAVWRSMGWRLREAGEYPLAVRSFRKALKLRSEEGQSRRDLALVLAEYGKSLAGFPAAAEAQPAALLSEAMALLKEAAFTNWARRSSRRSNDRQVAIIALEELNALIAWCEANNVNAEKPAIEDAFRRDLPVKIRIVLSWDADETDIDIHVLEPDGEEAFYGHRRTSSGGFVSEDVTTGYGPEEYLRKEAKGRFKILTNYYASHQTALTGAATATATVYTDYGTAAERMRILTLRLDKPKDKHTIGEIDVAE